MQMHELVWIKLTFLRIQANGNVEDSDNCDKQRAHKQPMVLRAFVTAQMNVPRPGGIIREGYYNGVCFNLKRRVSLLLRTSVKHT